MATPKKAEPRSPPTRGLPLALTSPSRLSPSGPQALQIPGFFRTKAESLRGAQPRGLLACRLGSRRLLRTPGEETLGSGHDRAASLRKFKPPSPDPGEREFASACAGHLGPGHSTPAPPKSDPSNRRLLLTSRLLCSARHEREMVIPSLLAPKKEEKACWHCKNELPFHGGFPPRHQLTNGCCFQFARFYKNTLFGVLCCYLMRLKCLKCQSVQAISMRLGRREHH